MRDQTRQLIQNFGSSGLWLSGALGLILFAACLTRLSQQFGYDWAVIDMPITRLAALLITSSVIFFLAIVVARTGHLEAPFKNRRIALYVMIVAGLIARLILFASEPALEDDYQRYLWDGAVTAHGINPYQSSPRAVINGGPNHILAPVADEAGLVLDRVNHKDLTTIYPPVAQATFALAHHLKPFSLTSWRALLLVADLATLSLLLLLLGLLNKSMLWAAVYWWNPVVLKEFFNSAHMDGLILPLVLGALYLALKARPVAATTSLAFAVGTKIWPVLLLPLLWRKACQSRKDVVTCVAVFSAICALLLVPYLAVGIGSESGTLAYAQRWTINSPLFTTVRGALRTLFATFGDPTAAAQWGSIAARLLLAGIVAAVALLMALRPVKDATDFITRALVIVAALILLSPAIYPWYTLWMLPLLALCPQLGLLLLFATIPLYYTYFYFAAREATALYQNGVVWIVWLPVWTWCLMSWFNSRRRADLDDKQTSQAMV